MLAMAGARQKSSRRAVGDSAETCAYLPGLPFANNGANRIGGHLHGLDQRTRPDAINRDVIQAHWKSYVGRLICRNEHRGLHHRSVHPHQIHSDPRVGADPVGMEHQLHRSNPYQRWTVDIERDGRKSILSKHGSMFILTDRCAPGCTWAERG